MYDDVGKKIKVIAKVACWVGIAFSVITGIQAGRLIGGLTGEFSFGTFFGTAIGGAFLSWLLSLFLYGFGELIENTNSIARRFEEISIVSETKHIKENNNEQVPLAYKVNGPGKAEKEIELKKVDIKIPADTDTDEYLDVECPYCNEKLAFTKQFLTETDRLTCPMCGEAFNTTVG
ncbi:MAG: hypothetical protein IJM34_03540 [Lachnospiraceae bacterium]|nr:hypothetical protein [Lachnospiraceae bacterium]